MTIPKDKIRAELKKRGISMKQLTSSMGYAETLGYHVLTGRCKNRDMQTAIAKAIDMDVTELFGPDQYNRKMAINNRRKYHPRLRIEPIRKSCALSLMGSHI